MNFPCSLNHKIPTLFHESSVENAQTISNAGQRIYSCNSNVYIAKPIGTEISNNSIIEGNILSL